MQTLPLGYAFTTTTTGVYAIPVGVARIRVQGSGTPEVSNDNSTFTALTLSNGEADTVAKFVRFTNAVAIVSIAKY